MLSSVSAENEFDYYCPNTEVTSAWSMTNEPSMTDNTYRTQRQLEDDQFIQNMLDEWENEIQSAPDTQSAPALELHTDPFADLYDKIDLSHDPFQVSHTKVTFERKLP